MNEREVRFTRSLLDNLRAIRDEIHAVQKDHETAGADRRTQQALPVKVEIDRDQPLAIAIREHYETEIRERKLKRRLLKSLPEWAGIGTALLLAFLTLGTLREIKQQTSSIRQSADAAIQQTDIARRQLEASMRPWVSLEVTLESPLTYDSLGGVHVGIAAKAKNTGHSAAPITFNIKMYPTKSEMFAAAEKNCAEARKMALPFGTIFPGEKQESPSKWDAHLTRQEIDQFALNGPDGRLLDTAILACVAYGPVAPGLDPYSTGYIFDLTDGRDPGIWVSRPVPLSRLRLTPSVIAGVVAR